jgi:hypothetical protein
VDAGGTKRALIPCVLVCYFLLLAYRTLEMSSHSNPEELLPTAAQGTEQPGETASKSDATHEAEFTEEQLQVRLLPHPSIFPILD